MTRIAVAPGDGIGRDVVAGPYDLLDGLMAEGCCDVVGPLSIGSEAYAATGHLLPDATLGACSESDAILLGAVGEDPRVVLSPKRPELALIALRERLDLRVSIREILHLDGSSLWIVRNLLGGAYDSRERGESEGEGAAHDRFVLEPERIREVARLSARLAARYGVPLISVDKANLLATSRLWRRVVTEVAEECSIEVRHVLVDRMAYELGVRDAMPAVIVTEGLFGDILSDLAAARAGSIALCGSASVRPSSSEDDARCAGLFEPVHGSAPSHVGKGDVNPLGAYLALSMLWDWLPSTKGLAALLRSSIKRSLRAPLTYDMSPDADRAISTRELSARINEEFWREYARSRASLAGQTYGEGSVCGDHVV